VLRLHIATQRLGGVSAAKGALRTLGLPGGWPRRPRLPVSEAAAEELAACFDALGLRDVEGL
jgi:dihydrodipicolinate synthase/N-acetylneuraminate lyase